MKFSWTIRKDIGAGLTIALLFVGGTIYAWENSTLKSSVGQIAYNFHAPQKENARQVELNPEVNKESSKIASTVTRTHSEVTRKKERHVRVLYPNGGEQFCLGDTLSIHWEYKNTKALHIFVVTPEEKYDFGVVSSIGESSDSVVPLFLKEGIYKVFTVSEENQSVQDTSDDWFTVTRCT